MGIVLISLVSAGLVPYLSNMVAATIEVKGPVFYAAPDKTLLINEEPSTHDTYIITDGNAMVFWTKESLGGTDFNYIPKLDLYIRAKVNNATPSKPLELIFGYSDTSSVSHEICPIQIIDISTEEWNDYHISCDGSSMPKNVNEFYYKIQGKGDQTIEYSISTENTKVETDKI
jgi:hypothetical protein